ncbi:MAG: CT398-like coiled coil hairpin domain-containing protein, partial [Chloroflexota bacterium]
MNAARDLYALQELDLRIASQSAKLAGERSKLQEPAAIRQARARLDEAQHQLAAAQKQVRSAEMDIASLTAKRKAVHDKLYSGKVTVPRELRALESEEENMSRSEAALEDRALEL